MSQLVVLVDQLLPYLLLDFLLCRLIIGVGIHQPLLFLHFFPLVLHLLLESSTDYLSNFKVILGCHSVTEFGVLVQKVVKLGRIVEVMLLNLLSF